MANMKYIHIYFSINVVYLEKIIYELVNIYFGHFKYLTFVVNNV